MKSLFIALKEIRTYLQDKGDLAFSLLLPIVVFALMYGAFGGQSIFHGTAYVVNEDQGGAYSTLLLDRLGKLKNIDVTMLSPSDADARLERSDLLLVLFIPAGFSARLASGQPAELIFKQRGNGGQEGQIVASLIRGEVQELSQEFQVQEQVKNALAGQNIPPDRIELTVQKYLDRQSEHPIVEVKEEAVGTEPDAVREFLPGIITMFVLFAITLSARAIVEERKKGTLERLLTTRLSISQLFTGKFLASMSRGFVQTLILLILSYIVFRLFTPLSFLESLVIALVFAAAASAVGLIIASLVRTEDAATWTAVFFTMVMTMLGGTFFSITPGSIWDTVSKASINTYANTAFKELIVRGGSLADVWLELVVMAGVAIVGLALSRVLFKVMPGGR